MEGEKPPPWSVARSALHAGLLVKSGALLRRQRSERGSALGRSVCFSCVFQCGLCVCVSAVRVCVCVCNDVSAASTCGSVWICVL